MVVSGLGVRFPDVVKIRGGYEHKKSVILEEERRGVGGGGIPVLHFLCDLPDERRNREKRRRV